MDNSKKERVDSPMGSQAIDTAGSPLGVLRMDPEKSYANAGDLLQKVIDGDDQKAWETIKQKIDYTFEKLCAGLEPLANHIHLQNELASRVNKGQKLLLKPNLVSPTNIDPQTHAPGMGFTACTEWPFIAALMRWFREKMGISYHQMCIGEAATAMTAVAGQFSTLSGKKITTEAVIEGRSKAFFGGWGFYFVRKYLLEKREPHMKDNPMNGYEESINGIYLTPGQAQDKLMVYDLNRIYDDESKGRRVAVPSGVNYQSIVLHKVIVGGDPENKADRQNYPGCILVNVPKFKVHAIALFTNVIKNLGIGLYPMQYAEKGGCKWDYSVPQNPTPGMKAGIPHQVWVSEINPTTCMPVEDENGQPILKKTGGITATMIDIIKAVKNQDIFMMHIVDAIEGINLDHQGIGIGVKEAEGMVFAGLDPVAVDLLSARYMFSNVPLEEAMASGVEDGNGGYFPQAVPIPEIEDGHIVSKDGFDCPLSRDVCFQNAKKRGLGDTRYQVMGYDGITGQPIVSIKGHLGYVDSGKFYDIITKALYFDVFKTPWDLQKTSMKYLESVDTLTGSTLKAEFLSSYDENGDGVVSYEEMGKKGEVGFLLHASGAYVASISKMTEALKGSFQMGAKHIRFSDPSLNSGGKDFLKTFRYSAKCLTAFQMSMVEMEAQDPFMPGLVWGKGKWPSFQMASYVSLGFALYGAEFPNKVVFPSLYYTALRYADLTQNEGGYLGRDNLYPDQEHIDAYISMASATKEKQLDFTLYIPPAYDNVGGLMLPNVAVTSDPAKILTADFNEGREIWP